MNKFEQYNYQNVMGAFLTYTFIKDHLCSLHHGYFLLPIIKTWALVFPISWVLSITHNQNVDAYVPYVMGGFVPMSCVCMHSLKESGGGDRQRMKI